MSDMKSASILLLLMATVSGAAAASELSISNEAKTALFEKCNAEGAKALRLARYYYLSEKDHDELRLRVLGDVTSEAWAEALISVEQSGEGSHYTFFAAEKLYRCFENGGAPLEKPQVAADVCYIQVDVPHFLFNLKRQGYSEKEARKQILERMNDRRFFPKKMIDKVTERVYAPGSESIQGYIEGNVFWGCYYEKEWDE